LTKKCADSDCGREYEKGGARGLCRNCYYRHHRAGDLGEYALLPFCVNSGPCRFGGCDGRAMVRGYCQAHYCQWNKTGQVKPLRRMRRRKYEQPCQFDGCSKLQLARGYCSGHYQQLNDGRPLMTIDRSGAPKKCSFGGCDRDAHARGYCQAHWAQDRAGRPLRLITKYDIRTACSYSGAHTRIRRIWGSARDYPCLECGDPAREWAYLGGDPEELYTEKPNKLLGYMAYSRFPEFYGPLCTRCHRQRDRARLHQEYEELQPVIQAWWLENRRIKIYGIERFA
jgi:hypothetical protein